MRIVRFAVSRVGQDRLVETVGPFQATDALFPRVLAGNEGRLIDEELYRNKIA